MIHRHIEGCIVGELDHVSQIVFDVKRYVTKLGAVVHMLETKTEYRRDGKLNVVVTVDYELAPS